MRGEGLVAEIRNSEIGQFIVLEGMEGSGKTTNLAYLKQLIEAQEIDLDVTREPGGTAIAEKLRDLLLHDSNEKIDSTTELLLMFAARQQHLQQRILPTLKQGTWVLCDRFIDATYAYQGGGRGFENTSIAVLEKLCGLQKVMPDWVIILDVPCEVSAQRVRDRGIKEDRFEREQRAFFERVRSVYLERATQSKHYSVIDASQSLASVQAEIKRLFKYRYVL